MVFQEKCFICYILLTDQVSLSAWLYFLKYCAIWKRKEVLRWNKKHFSSFIKGFQFSKIVSDMRVCLSRQLSYYSPAKMQDFRAIPFHHKYPRHIHKNLRPLIEILVLQVSILTLKVCYHDKPFHSDENTLLFYLIPPIYYSLLQNFIENMVRLLVICFLALRTSYKRSIDDLL